MLVVVPAVVLALVFTGGVLTGRRLADPPPSQAAPPAPTQTVTVTPEPRPDDVPPERPSAPTQLVVPSLDIKADVIDIALSPDAVLEPPEDPSLVGWWDDSAEPGALSGRVVITGHTVADGGGALDLLPELESGKIVLKTATGRHRYRVTDNLVASYAEVAEHARDIFGQTEKSPEGARLILVTCTDYNGRFYESNAIVVAEPI